MHLSGYFPLVSHPFVIPLALLGQVLMVLLSPSNHYFSGSSIEVNFKYRCDVYLSTGVLPQIEHFKSSISSISESKIVEQLSHWSPLVLEPHFLHAPSTNLSAKNNWQWVQWSCELSFACRMPFLWILEKISWVILVCIGLLVLPKWSNSIPNH